jgi:hypothetical protein
MFYALSTNQAVIASKLNLFVALAPVVRFQGVPWFMKAAQVIDGQLSYFFNSQQIYSLFGVDFTDKLKKIEANPLAGPFIRAFMSAVYATDSVNN